MEIFNSIFSIIKTIQFRDVVDILAIALLIFGLFKLVQETRAVQLLKGVIILIIVYFLSSLFGLVMLSSLLRTFLRQLSLLSPSYSSLKSEKLLNRWDATTPIKIYKDIYKAPQKR